MKTAPIVPAAIEIDAAGVPFSPRYGDVYHPRVGAAAQARHVFLGGNELPARWQGRRAFTVVETGFGLGNNFLVTWDAWRRDPARSERLCFVSVELHPPRRESLLALHRGSALSDLAAKLVDAWPPATPDLHRIAFDDGRVELLLAFGDAAAWLPELEVAADAFFLDGFAPARNPGLWDARICKALGRLAADGATLATWTAAQSVRAGLASAGFEVRLGAGIGGKRDITLARYRPVHRSPLPPRRMPGPAPADRRALIVGGGLAGTATACALAERGWRSALYERQPQLAAEASGNPAGLFHGTVHAEDGVHARFGRAAAFAARPAIECSVAAHGVAGSLGGLLRLETRLDRAAMQALLERSAWPSEYVQAVGADAASALAGIRLSSPAWHYPGGGWVDPSGLARAWAERAGDCLDARLGVTVASVRSVDGRWHVLDARGRTIDEAGVLILANADDTSRLLGEPGWPIERLRGQISVMEPDLAPPDLRHLRLPVAGGGYLIPSPRGLVFGATRQRGDDDPLARRADHAQNLARLEALLASPLCIDPDALGGRAAWRSSATDRLPVIGAVPALAILRGACPSESRWDRPRNVPREPGLFVFTALGSRGITTSALGAQVLAAQIAGTAVPLAASLLDAIDPARFVSRALRRAFAARQGAGCP